MNPTDALMGLSIRFFPETHRLAPIFTTQLLNLVGGVMTPPYDGLPDKSKFTAVPVEHNQDAYIRHQGP